MCLGYGEKSAGIMFLGSNNLASSTLQAIYWYDSVYKALFGERALFFIDVSFRGFLCFF